MVGIFQQERIVKAEEQIAEKRRYINYDTREFTIESIVKYLEEEETFLPEYHRDLVWDSTRQSKFIESIFLGLPILPLFVAKIQEPFSLEIIDGSQRVLTLAAFMTNKLQLIHLKTLDSLNGFSFSDFSPSHQRKFKNTSINVIILFDADEISKKDISNRINTY
ncbi:DUF262 domain-containing protein [Pseudanabaena sp. ABRG5-3]|uniref:DUF262 domain-containing protein n=1 Tax=Pseudanabaena sp. ABRG5-3 TaxID=685565 RepID=UPI000DC6E869|nr:DUF262 domain-containing protein [Pseudanabaena sp. ABRG5-3]BBC24613.1 hypothetical protein ABRG53_2356 [Pseudanabaena sp. ABRG5-3]